MKYSIFDLARYEIPKTYLITLAENDVAIYDFFIKSNTVYLLRKEYGLEVEKFELLHAGA